MQAKKKEVPLFFENAVGVFPFCLFLVFGKVNITSFCFWFLAKSI